MENLEPRDIAIEPTVVEAIRQMVMTAIQDGRISKDGSYVSLSVDSLTQLGCVPEEADELLAKYSHENQRDRQS